MSLCATTLFFLLAMVTTINSSLQDIKVLEMAQSQVLQARNWIQSSMRFHGSVSQFDLTSVALRDCGKLYEDSEFRLAYLVSGESNYSGADARTWLSGVMANHRSCLDGLSQKGYVKTHDVGSNLTMLLDEALVLYKKSPGKGQSMPRGRRPIASVGNLASWSPATSKADFTVAQDGSGTHKTIRDAMAALARLGHNRPERVIVYVKSGVYAEKVKIGRNMNNVMFIGAGIDKTIVTGNRNVMQGSTTLSSATFDVSGDGFWARDMTFENTAGPHRHQSVALKVSSDLSIFYRCSFKGYQDTLYVHSNRQFYYDCHIYGTVDFIFGDASAVLQNCDIFVRKPMVHQTNFIAAQGRDNPNEPTGISILNCRVRPASDFVSVKDSYKSYLGRPWKKYSRTVFLKTELDGLIEPEGWNEWTGNFAISTLYYGEYMNTGNGASTENRVNWPGFHVFKSSIEASPFTVSQFIHGERWIPASGVPFWPGI